MDSSIPVLSATLSLSSNTYSFSNDEAPKLNITVTSKHRTPITIYADDLSPALLRKHGALTITDLATGTEVPQAKRTHCIFEPPTRVEVELDEGLFHELLPGRSVTLSAPFSRERRPLPKGAPGFEDAVDARNACASGVDGLEPGHSYLITLSQNSRVHWTTIRWWEYGTKEEVLRRGIDEIVLNARKVKYRAGPHEPIRLDLSGLTPLELTCTE